MKYTMFLSGYLSENNGIILVPKLWLGMTATPDKRDDNVKCNVYELFNYQIALTSGCKAGKWKKTCSVRSIILV